MTKVTIKLLESGHMADFYTSRDTIETAQELMTQGKYKDAGTIETDKVGDAAAEEAFDLTNNPSRLSERLQTYGRGRSVSVGDIAEVEGVQYLCAGTGWTEMPAQRQAKPSQLSM